MLQCHKQKSETNRFLSLYCQTCTHEDFTILKIVPNLHTSEEEVNKNLQQIVTSEDVIYIILSYLY